MKRIVAIFFIIGFALPYLIHVSQITWFMVNKSYVIQELCIQRNQEENTCQGSCHLKKELSKIESSDAQDDQKPLQLTEVEIPVFITSEETVLPSDVSSQIDFVVFCYQTTQSGYPELPDTPPKYSFS